MKTKILKVVLFFSCFIVSSCNAQCDNKLAIEKFKKELEAVKYAINNPNTNRKDLPVIIDRLEEITLIQSVSDGNYFGKLNPTEGDIEKWKDWLTSNEEKLCWNGNDNKFYIRK